MGKNRTTCIEEQSEYFSDWMYYFGMDWRQYRYIKALQSCSEKWQPEDLKTIIFSIPKPLKGDEKEVERIISLWWEVVGIFLQSAYKSTQDPLQAYDAAKQLFAWGNAYLSELAADMFGSQLFHHTLRN